MSIYIDFKPGKEIEWLELNLLISNKSITKSIINGLQEDLEERDIDSWLTNMDIRSGQFDNQIYKIDNSKIIPLINWQQIPEYLLCLYYSFYGAEDDTNGKKLFEQISASALKNFINGDVIVLGHPSSSNLNDNLDNIAIKINEQRGQSADSSYKDDGVDAIGYKTFDDGRGSNLYILLQSAAGKNWTTKHTINLNRWRSYINWYDSNIITSIATVDYISQKNWKKHYSNFGMLLDRMRIYNCFYKNEIDSVLHDQVVTWCRDQLPVN